MTPAQRKYDQDLIKSLRTMAQNILPRSRKLHDIFKIAADRIEALGASIPADQPNQPASTSDPKSAPEPKQLEPMRD